MKKLSLFRKQCVYPYANFVAGVKAFSWSKLNLEELSFKIKFCDKFNHILLYSLVKEVIYRFTGYTLFDTQISAAYSMAQGKIAELPTGEGKTLSAVMTATCLALQGKSIHIFTFNDYLAKRDFTSNKNIFEFCGITTDFIQEKSNRNQRKQAYSCSIVYASAKQVGYDYLKNFLCKDLDDFIPINFDTVIVDEADSILIDEARLPLAIAGPIKPDAQLSIKVDKIIEKMDTNNIVVDKFKNRFWLTDLGISFLEKSLQIDNLYNESNYNLLTLINSAVEARYLLEKDKDYIVKDNQILIIEQTTGRVATDRKFPHALHQAVETKEKIVNQSQTLVYNSMPLQFFILKYKFICGMSGTAKSSSKELKTMYNLPVDVIPPNTPTIRKEHPDYICENEAERMNMAIGLIKKSNSKGQPVLICTQSVKASEEFSALLTQNNLHHKVLNARNDNEEAQIISKAGKPYMITISTNMAGRGVDIGLGGLSKDEKQFVMMSGGLFVIGFGINESPRIDKQLIGRCGRQGDPGESIFFISKEDPLFLKYFSTKKINNSLIKKQIRNAQKYEEGKSAEARYMLSKYAYVLEVQRQRITAYRNDILQDVRYASFLQNYEPIAFSHFCSTIGLSELRRAEKQLTLYFINQHWADYLYTMENVRNGIHLSIIGGLNPIDEYNKAAVAAFSEMEQDIKNDVIQHLKTCKISENGTSIKDFGFLGASNTYSYMIDESKSQFARFKK